MALGTGAGLAANKAKKPAKIGKNDFAIAIREKQDAPKIDLLTHNLKDIEKISGNVFEEANKWDDDEPEGLLAISEWEATFYTAPGLNYVFWAKLTRYGATARGVRMGEAWSKVRATYGKPTESYAIDDCQIYTYYVGTFTPMSDAALNKKRPVDFYWLRFVSDAKKKTIEEIHIERIPGE